MASLIFYGTGNFAATLLSAIIEAGHEVKLVICQPDWPIPPEAVTILQNLEIDGKTGFDTKQPVAALAERFGLGIVRPRSLKDQDSPRLRATKADVGVACEYGFLIPKRLLDLPAHGTLNLHPSLLPRYRGPTPIQSALLNGEEKTGASVILMDERIDCGPILSSAVIEVPQKADAHMLEDKLAILGAGLLVDTLPRWLAGDIKPVLQDESQATYCRRFYRSDGRIDWRKNKKEICNQFRGLCIWPGVWSVAGGQIFDFLRLKPASRSLKPGMMSFQDGRVFIGCGDGSLEVPALQKGQEGFLGAREFVKCHPEMDGLVLG